jgi:hypothetical protein
MRIVLAMLAALTMLSCAHQSSAGESGKEKCPESDKTSMCSSGPLKCELDEKRQCDLCKCEHYVY